MSLKKSFTESSSQRCDKFQSSHIHHLQITPLLFCLTLRALNILDYVHRKNNRYSSWTSLWWLNYKIIFKGWHEPRALLAGNEDNIAQIGSHRCHSSVITASPHFMYTRARSLHKYITLQPKHTSISSPCSLKANCRRRRHLVITWKLGSVLLKGEYIDIKRIYVWCNVIKYLSSWWLSVVDYIC